MKFVSFRNADGAERLGFFCDGTIIDLSEAAKSQGANLPNTMLAFLNDSQKHYPIAQNVEKAWLAGKIDRSAARTPEGLLAPVPQPPSCRDAYAFRQHVASARRNRGMDMIPEFDQFPIFYYTNHNAMVGEGEVLVEDDHLRQLDFELEIAAVLGRGGKNVRSQDADGFIFGFTIMNDFSARFLQMEEMKLSLGPAKGKDFATAIGPWLVTKDELAAYRVATPFGDKYDLKMTAFHNGKQVSAGNVQDMNWTFAEIIERCAYGAKVFPGDVIGSGTVGTGCYMELNGTWTREAKERGETHQPVWLQDGDLIELEITGLGRLRNRIVKNKEPWSILDKRKNL